MPPNRFRALLPAVVLGLIGLIFLLDLNTPLGVAVPFLYLLLAFFAIWVGADTRLLLAIAVAGPLLSAFKMLAAPEDGVFAFGQANRVLFAVLIWAAVGLEWLRRRIEAERHENRRNLERLVRERTTDLNLANQELEREVAERKLAEQTITDYAERLQALTGQLVEAQEAERKALATELHDRIGQNLSALNMSLNLQLTLLAARLPADQLAPVKERIDDALALVEKTTELVRGVMEELHPALLDQYGLDTALRWYGEEFAGRTGIAVRHRSAELFPRLKARVEMTLFRIAQEALTNVAKHARAGEVVLALNRHGGGIELLVSDDGVGIAPGAGRPASGGWGLAIMAERAHSVGATLTIEQRAEGHGTRLLVTVPNGFWENP